MSSTRRFLLPSILGLLLVLVVPAVAVPPPGPVCTACAPAYEESAAADGVDIRVAESAAVVRVHENGSATWTVGLALAGPDAKRVGENESLHERIARDATGKRFAGTGQRSFAGPADMPDFGDGGEPAVYYSYRVDGFAEQGVGGTLVTTHFRDDLSVANYQSLGVDRLTVSAPGMEVTRAPSSADVVSGLSGSAFTLTSVDEAIVTFYPRQASNPVELLWANLLAELSVAAVLLPVLKITVGVLLLPAFVVHAAVVGALLGVVARVGVPDASASSRRTTVGLLAATAVVVAGQPLYADAIGLPVLGGDPNPVLPACALGVAVVAAGVARPALADRPLLRGRAPVSLDRGGSLAVKGSLAAVVAGGVIGTALPGETAWSVVGLTLMTVGPMFALVPAAYAAVDGRALHGVAAASVGYFVGGFASPVLYTAPQGVIFPGFFFAPVVTGTVLAVGWPLLLAGWTLTGGDRLESVIGGR